MNNYIFLFLLIALLNYITLIYAENDYYIVAIGKKGNDTIYNDKTPELQLKFDIFVNDKMNDIYEVIEKHKNSYILQNGKMDEKLEELNNSVQLRKRSNKRKHKFLFTNKIRKNNHKKLKKHFSELKDTEIEYIQYSSKLVNHICPIKNYYAIRVLLSKETKEIICTPEYALYCEKDKKEELEIKRNIQQIENKYENEYININKRDNNNNNNNNSESVYYDIAAIENETKWSNVSVQAYPYTPNHLALISQSPYIDDDNDVNKSFDNNFYYPSSAGKGIDIYLIDTGIIVDHDEFDTSHRNITCDALSSEYDFEETDERDRFNCTIMSDYLYHGIGVASIAGGKIHGVAKNANLHMIAMDATFTSILKAMDYILQNAKNPNKTIINMSYSSLGYSEPEHNKLRELYDAGFTLVTPAANDDMNCSDGKESDDFRSPAGYNETIVVGATTSELYGDGHYRADYSNYGKCIDIFAPGNVIFPNLSNGSKNRHNQATGTCFSAPIVVGIIATIMSENPEGVYNTEIIRKKLIEMSINNSIRNIGSSDTPNRFVNNGKTSIYKPKTDNATCGSQNNQYCSDGCCSKDGKCLHYRFAPLEECIINTDNEDEGCQEIYSNQCITKEKAIKDCESELNDNQECLLDFQDLNLENRDNLDKRLNSCSKLKSSKCSVFLKKLVNNLSICSVAKKYESFKLIENYSKKDYYDSLNICENNDYMRTKERCKPEVEEYKSCFIDENTNFNDYNNFGKLSDRCSDIKSDLCSNLYNREEDGLKNKLKYCYYSYIYHINSLNFNNYIYRWTGKKIFFDDRYNVYDDYTRFCENIENKSIDMCNKILNDNTECLINKNNNDTLYCNDFKSVKCQRLYQSFNNPNFVCNVAKKLNNSFDLNDKFDSDIYSQYQQKCEMETLHSNMKPRWIYNASLNKCLYASEDNIPLVKDFKDDINFIWYINSSSITVFQSAANIHRYLNVLDLNNPKLTLDMYNEGKNFEFNYNENNGLINPLYLNFKKKLCMSIGNDNSSIPDSVYLRNCTESDDQKWKLYDANPIGNSKSNTRIVWIYNKKRNMCIESGENYNDRPTIINCNSNNKTKWEIPIYGNGYYKSLYRKEGYCLNLDDINGGKLVMKECNNNAVMADINFSYNGKYIKSTLHDNKCLGSFNPNDDNELRLQLNKCSISNEDQEWEIVDHDPSIDDQKSKPVKENPPNITSTKTRTVWIYNVKTKMCLESGDDINDSPRIIHCNTYERNKWEIPVSGDGYYKSLYKGKYFLNFDDINEGKIVMKECNNNAIILDIDSSNNGKSIISTLNTKKCLGLDPNGSDEKLLKMNDCSTSKDDQEWEIYDHNPYIIPISTNNKCSRKDGKCPSGKCCSKNGLCGTSKEYCSIENGCQSEFGQCDNIKISTNDKCGIEDGKCPSGKCCSKYGWCGVTEEHCSIENGCQSEFGQCGNINISTNIKISTNDKCGIENGKCPSGKCCSNYGWCGTTDEYCSLKNGCQSEFGQCK